MPIQKEIAPSLIGGSDILRHVDITDLVVDRKNNKHGRVSGFYKIVHTSPHASGTLLHSLLSGDGPFLVQCLPDDPQMRIVSTTSSGSQFHRASNLTWEGPIPWSEENIKDHCANYRARITSERDQTALSAADYPQLLASFSDQSSHQDLAHKAWQIETDQRMRRYDLITSGYIHLDVQFGDTVLDKQTGNLSKLVGFWRHQDGDDVARPDDTLVACAADNPKLSIVHLANNGITHARPWSLTWHSRDNWDIVDDAGGWHAARVKDGYTLTKADEDDPHVFASPSAHNLMELQQWHKQVRRDIIKSVLGQDDSAGE